MIETWLLTRETLKAGIKLRPDVYLANADRDDLELLLAWRNHPEIYRYFENQKGYIAWEDHLKWWHSRENRKDYIIYADSHKVGSTYATKLNTDWPEVGLYIGEISAHNKGIGRAALNLICRTLIYNKKYKGLIGRIDPENIASVKIFEGIGFYREGKYEN